MTCLPALLAASAVIAASLLGGCSDTAIGTVGGNGRASALPRAAAQAPPPAVERAPLPPVDQASLPAADQAPPRAADRAPSPAAGPPVGERLASAALDDGRLSEIRGGFETSSGVVLNFAFQQATFVNHSLAQSIVVPTLTISPSQGAASVAAAVPAGGAAPPTVNIGSLAGLSVSTPQNTPGVSATTVLANGTVQTQVSASSPAVQALVNSGMTSIVSTIGNNGVANVITNTASNRLVQQVTTVDIGVSGLSKMIQQGIPSTVLNQLVGPNSFR